MTLFDWAKKWGVSHEAIVDLGHHLKGEYDTATQANAPIGTSESAVGVAVRLEAAEKGGILWRNNVGAATDQNGNFFRYGLCNDNKAINAAFKSSDLVGILPVKIGIEHVGQVIGRFICRETKRANWRYTGSTRERAQLRFIELVTSLGGDGAFAKGRGSL